MYNNFFPQYPMYQHQQKQELIRVNGLESAKSFQMPASSTVALFDNNDDVMYIKQTDGAGFPTIRVFRFTEQTAQVPDQNVQVDSMAEIKNALEEIKGMLINGKQSVRKQTNGTDHE